MYPRLWFLTVRRTAKPVAKPADACAAFLTGRSAAYLQSHGQDVPPWAQLNRVARGSPDQLRSLAAAGPRTTNRRRKTQTWGGALALLAEQLLADAPNDAGLLSLQRSALWPLESELIDAGDRVAMKPGEVFIVALGCIVDALD